MKILFLIFILVFSLRLFQLSFFEFKNDQLDNINFGNSTRQAYFLITHGLRSGSGINNPPLFLWFMGIVTFFTNNPFYITALFLLFNLLALLLAMRYFYLRLPRIYALLASVLLAFSPAFTTYSSNIWPQCLLPILMVLFHTALYGFIKGRKNLYFIFLGILTVLASQLHLSGFFLFPLLVIIVLFYWDKIGIKRFIATLLLGLLIFSPYICHLFFEGELKKFPTYSDFLHQSVYWKVFREHLRMSSFDFFRYYFPSDFDAVLTKTSGIFRFILYPLSCILMLFFVFGLLSYLVWLIRGRRLFNIDSEVIKDYPLPFQIAGFMVLGITLGYLIFRIHSPPHYLIILFPSYSLMTAFSAYKIWHFTWAKIVIFCAILSTVILLTEVFIFLSRSGGHSSEYGPSYQALLNFKKELWSKIPAGYCPDLSVFFTGKGKSDKEAVSMVVMGAKACDSAKHIIPVKLIINWNDCLMRYEHLIEIAPYGNPVKK